MKVGEGGYVWEVAGDRRGLENGEMHRLNHGMKNDLLGITWCFMEADRS